MGSWYECGPYLGFMKSRRKQASFKGIFEITLGSKAVSEPKSVWV